MSSSVAASISALHLDVENQCLWWGEQAVPLTPKAFTVLRYLVEHSDRLVTKEALLNAAWHDAYVEEGQVKQFVAELRKMLHDDPKAPRFIETVRGRGYRFIGDIRLRGIEAGAAPEVGRSGQDAAGHPGPCEVDIERNGLTGAEPARATERGTVGPASWPSQWGNRPSIAVLPFRNLGNDPHQDYFGEGITEDIIAALARTRSLLVIARHSTLPYRDRHADARCIGAELGVRYIVEGSVRRQGPKLRIVCELVDADRNQAIWAQKYDGTVEDLFDFQDRIAASVVAMIEPHLLQAEQARVRGKPTDSFDAYDCLLHAFSRLYTLNEGDFNEAGAFLDRAIRLDPLYAQAHAYKAIWHVLQIGEGRSIERRDDAASAEGAAQRAVDLDPDDAVALAIAGHVESFVSGRPESAVEIFRRSLDLNEYCALAWGLSAVTHCYLGQPDEALARLNRVWRLSPFDLLNNFWFWTAAGLAEFLAGRYERAVTWLQRPSSANAGFVPRHRTLTACLALQGRLDEAHAAAREFLARQPNFRISTFTSWYPLRRPDDLRRYAAGLQAAGLPD